MDIVLGVSMAPASVQMVLVEGENADGVLVEEDGFGVTAVDDSDPTTLPDQVIAAILGTREGAAEAGFELSSIGVTWTDQVQASVLRDALSAHRLENVMLVSAFLAAWENRPTRAEPLCALARYLREHSRFALAQLFAARAVYIPKPDDVLFVDDSVYSWRSKDELAIASYWCGDYAACRELCLELLAGDALPDEQRARVTENLRYAEQKLA